MTDFIKLTKITDWKLDNNKKEPTATKTVYVRPQDIVSFEDDDGTTVVRFTDCEKINTTGIHVKETPSEIYEMIRNEKKEYTIPYIPTWRDPLDVGKGFWWDTDWWKNPQITCDSILKNTPYYGYAIVFGNGEVWE